MVLAWEPRLFHWDWKSRNWAISIWMKVAAGIAAGFKQATLMVIAHDAGHGNTTTSKKLNRLISILGFMPTLFNYRLWLYDHNKSHHYATNDPHRDLYKPFSKAEFDALPRWRQVLERFGEDPVPASGSGTEQS